MLERIKTILSHPGDLNHDAINLRRWFIIFIAYLAVLALITLLALQWDTPDRRTAHNISLLALYLFYMSLCCSFFPGPTAWIVLLMASPVFGLIDPAFLQHCLGLSTTPQPWLTAAATVLIVAVVGALGTTMANLNEYHLLTFLLRFGKVNRIKRTRLYQLAARYFTMNPFWLMTAVNFLPIPIDVIRWLAVSHAYRRDHFAYAGFLGRLLRYALFAAAAFYLEIGTLGIIIIQAAIILLVLIRYLPKLVSSRTHTAGTDGNIPQSLQTDN